MARVLAASPAVASIAVRRVTARIRVRGPVAAIGMAAGRSSARALSPVGELIRLVEEREARRAR
jgi:hypothetical protein